MSARHRHVKKRIREIEQELQRLGLLARSYTQVIADAADNKATVAMLGELYRFQDAVRERFYQLSLQQQREETKLAAMPKRLGATP